ncbi:hypothetical protein [Chitinophaga filiformis]|uniref:Uncharacterized protein n=1 Tax=Chitinophaga filiformis TaxID=104663 RepID=A0A1G7Y1T6_CHIFI|nr:hypothetical protein [Chitinophaga filiformis]SDG90357.1 hypothetical protein SAMN04488121_107169 [Chitinophaga filiformis]
MSKQNSIIPLSGKLRDMVGYYRRNKKGKKEWWWRRAPQNVQQTAPTKRAATDFGTASRCSRLVRHALRPWLRYYGYHFDHNRLNKAFINIIKADTDHNTGFKVLTHHNMQSLRGFNFNSDKTIHEFLTSPPLITSGQDNTTTILLPGIHLSNTKTNKGITHVTVKAIALPFDHRQDAITPVASETITIKRKDIHQAITLTLPASKEQTIILLEIQCGYEINNTIEISANKQTAAMDVIAVLPAVKPKKIRRIFRNKTPQLYIIPPCCQPVKNHQLSQTTSLYPLKE